MHIDPKAPVVQLARDQHIMTALVVLGPGHATSANPELAGRIKSVNFGPHTQSCLLGAVDYIRRADRVVGVKDVHLSAEELSKGSRFLRDLFVEEGRLADYDAVVSWYRAIAEGRKVAPLPDEYLPKKVIAWRQSCATTDVFALPPKAEFEPAGATEKPAARRRAGTSDSPPAGGF